MTHPTLGYANFRLPGDDAVHMPATPTATLTVACRAGNDPATVAAAYEVDAQVDCPGCAQALEADWWMALMENERRTGETTSLSGTLDDVSTAMQRLLSQTDAVVEETMLGGGASLVEQPRSQPVEVSGGVRWSGFPWERPGPVPLPLKGIATGNADDMLAMARQLEAADEAIARQLAASPLAALKRYQISHGEWAMDVTPSLAKEGPWQGEAPLLDPGAERVRKAIEAAQRELAKHPFDENVTVEYNGEGLPAIFDPSLPEDVALIGSRRRLGLSPEEQAEGLDQMDHNWCHVHNRPSLPDSELCQSCMADQCERCNYDTHICKGCGEPLTHGVEVCEACS